MKFVKGEEVYSSLKGKDQGKPGIYFVVKGTLKVVGADQAEIATLVAPFTFGETASLEGLPMCAAFCLLGDCTSFSATVESDEMECLLLSAKEATMVSNRRCSSFIFE